MPKSPANLRGPHQGAELDAVGAPAPSTPPTAHGAGKPGSPATTSPTTSVPLRWPPKKSLPTTLRSSSKPRPLPSPPFLRAPPEGDSVLAMTRRHCRREGRRDLLLVLKPYHFLARNSGSTHGSPNEYDAHVPIVSFAACPRRRPNRSAMKTWPTLSALLGVAGPTPSPRPPPVQEGQGGLSPCTPPCSPEVAPGLRAARASSALRAPLALPPLPVIRGKRSDEATPTRRSLRRHPPEPAQTRSGSITELTYSTQASAGTNDGLQKPKFANRKLNIRT